MVGDSTIRIEKFNGKNSFGLWQIKMKALLKQLQIWRPLIPKSAASTSGSGDGWTDEQLVVMEEKAHSTILLSLDDHIITEVADQETAAELWLKLESLYMTKSLTNKLLLKQRLFSLRMQSGTPLRNHLENLNSILLDLRNLDVKIDDEDAALILLVSLPNSYGNFVESFVVGKDSLTLEEVKAALYTRELRQKATGDNNDYGSGLVVRSGKNSRKKNGSNNSNGASTDGSSNTRNIICYHCREPGHFRSKCPELKNKSQATVVESKQNKSYDSEEDLALISCVESNDLFDSWVLDSGSSFHMSPRRDWFDTYESCFGGSVTIANGTPCEVVGIGSIRLRTREGLL